MTTFADKGYVDVVADFGLQSGVPGQTGKMQAAVDWLYENYFGGNIFVRPGNYQTPGVVGKGAVSFIGSGRSCTTLSSGDTDSGVITFDTSVKNAVLRDIAVVGYQNPSSQSNAVTIMNNVKVDLQRVDAVGGYSGLYNCGIDCNLDDCTIAGYTINYVTQGACWHRRLKLDLWVGAPHIALLIGEPFPGASSAEDSFSQCDMSGVPISVQIAGDGRDTVFDNRCIFAGDIQISLARMTKFIGSKFGSLNFTCNNGGLVVVGCDAITPSPLIIAGAVGSGNINITLR